MSLTTLEIESLIELCKKGNQQAQMEVYNRYYKAMYNVAYRIVRDSFEAEDIMQDSFLKAFRKLDTLREPSTFGVWLKRIVVNKSIYTYNKTKSKKEESIDQKLYKLKVVQDDEQDNEGRLKQKAKMVMKKIDELKDNYRMGLTLHLIEGYDYDEISEIMDISYGNCRTMISRAKESLRSKLQPLINYNEG
ncbi:MAG: RNA polymerase sigma factor [Flavobacteriaceae bacterium]|nr:RNA polymerase sigma factor [Flavobacteriaceae bacterium]